MIYKRCSRCGKRIPSGTVCPCVLEVMAKSKRERDRTYSRTRTDTRELAFYGSDQWRRKSKAVRIRFRQMDVYLWHTTGRVVDCDTVHHIEPIKERWDKRLMDSNLIPLSESTHKALHKRMERSVTEKKKVQAELHEAIRHWKAVFGPG